MRIFRVRGEVVDLIAIGASSCLVQEFLRRRKRHARTVQWRPVAAGCYGAHLVQIAKNPPKIRIEKFVKLTDYPYACNNLTCFGCKAETETTPIC